VFILRLSVVVCLLSITPGATAADVGEPAWWVERAEQLAMELSGADQQAAAWMAVAAFHGRQGDFQAARAAARRIADPGRRTECLRYVTIRIARGGAFSVARQFADTIGDPAARASGLAWIARIQAERHLFDAARETLRSVDDPVQLAWARHQLAYEEAAAGRYADARADAARIVPATPEDELLKDDLLAWIDEAEATGRCPAPKPPSETPVTQARQMLGPLGYRGLSDRDLDRLERRARQSGDPGKQSAAWRRIAWIHLAAGDTTAAGAALARAEEHLANIADRRDRIAEAAAVADLYLESNDPAAAERVVGDHLFHGDSGESLIELADYRTAALIVGVVARTSGAEEAAAMVRSSKSPCQAAWWATGAFSGWLKTPTATHPLLAPAAPTPNQFALCMGTAQGLAARRGKKPDPSLSPTK